jgi:hypothetical protein
MTHDSIEPEPTPAEDPRMTDEATGLPPLGSVDPENTIFGLGYFVGRGTTMNDSGVVPVVFLGVRGLDRDNVWAQCFIAIPEDGFDNIVKLLAAKGESAL